METFHTKLKKTFRSFTVIIYLLLVCGISFSQLNVGLRAYYLITGNTNDFNGNNNNLSIINAALITDTFGNANSAYQFNGTSNFIRVPNSPTLNMSNQILFLVA